VIVVADIFAGLTAALGWYYLFYSRAAGKLEGVEAERINHRRVRLRRTGGAIMMLLGVLFFAGFQELAAVPFILVWIGVMLSLLAIVALALIDLRLTWGLQQSRRQGPR
jgi:hypothetical protein